MPPVPRFEAELTACPVASFAGKCFRVVELEAFTKSSSPTLLFDLGPKIAKGGQRFSPPNDHRGLYVSTELITAGSEFAGGRAEWVAGDCAKHVTFDMEVALGSVLDLTSARIRRVLHTSKEEILSAWEGFAVLNGGRFPPTWTLGQSAFASGRFDGIHFPSNRNASGTCLLIFTERLVAGRTHVVINRQDGSLWERLP